MDTLTLAEAKTLSPTGRHHWVQEAEDYSRFGYRVGEIAYLMEATAEAVRYLLNYHAAGCTD